MYIPTGLPSATVADRQVARNVAYRLREQFGVRNLLGDAARLLEAYMPIIRQELGAVSNPAPLAKCKLPTE